MTTDKILIRRWKQAEIMSKRTLYRGMVIVLGVLLAATLAGVRAGQLKRETVRIGNADLNLFTFPTRG